LQYYHGSNVNTVSIRDRFPFVNFGKLLANFLSLAFPATFAFAAAFTFAAAFPEEFDGGYCPIGRTTETGLLTTFFPEHSEISGKSPGCLRNKTGDKNPVPVWRRLWADVLYCLGDEEILAERRYGCGALKYDLGWCAACGFFLQLLVALCESGRYPVSERLGPAARVSGKNFYEFFAAEIMFPTAGNYPFQNPGEYHISDHACLVTDYLEKELGCSYTTSPAEEVPMQELGIECK